MKVEGWAAENIVNKKLGIYSFVVEKSKVKDMWQDSCSDSLLFFLFSRLVILQDLKVLILMIRT